MEDIEGSQWLQTGGMIVKQRSQAALVNLLNAEVSFAEKVLHRLRIADSPTRIGRCERPFRDVPNPSDSGAVLRHASASDHANRRDQETTDLRFSHDSVPEWAGRN